jgi:citrate synthase
VIDIRKLYGQTGMFTYDPGFLSTASCNSTITYIDGDKGELLYRGYPIEQLATNCDFLETCHLLLYGDLPNGGQGRVHQARDQPHHGERADAVLPARLPSRRAPDGHHDRPGGRAVGLLSRQHRHQQPEHREISAIRLIAKMPTLVAMAYKYSGGSALHVPAQRAQLCGQLPAHDVCDALRRLQVNPVIERALDRIFILHADHEQNASTSTVRLCGSRAPTRLRPSLPAWPACGVRARRRQRGLPEHAGPKSRPWAA